MSVLTHTPHAFRERRAPTVTHLAMIKRFAAFMLMVGGFAITVTAVISLKLAIYLPSHLFH